MPAADATVLLAYIQVVSEIEARRIIYNKKMKSFNN